MASKASCLKLITNGIPLENNNYLFTLSSKSKTCSFPLKKRRVGVDMKGGGGWCWYMVAGCAALLCYLNSLKGDLVHDDLVAIVRNPDVRPSTPISHIFLHDYWGRPVWDPASHKSYRPLTVLTFRLNYAWAQLQPWSYHVVNVCLHCLATLLFTCLCDTVVFSDPTWAGLSAVLFAVHPIHTEAVSGVVGRADILSCIGFLYSFLSYHRCISQHTSRRYLAGWLSLLLSLVLATAAMLCKEQGVTIMAVCLMYDVFQHLQNNKRVKKETQNVFMKRIMVTGVTLVCVLSGRVYLMGGQPPIFKEEDNPAAFSSDRLVRVMSYCWIYVCNIWQLMCPLTLSYDWQMGSIPLVTSLSDTRNLLTLLIICVMIYFIYHIHRGFKSACGKCIFLGLAFLVLPFLPASNIFFTVGFTMAERVLYIPSCGFIILFMEGAYQLRKQLKAAGVQPMVLVLICALLWSCRTVTRNQAWQSRHFLFKSGLQTLPNNAKMHYNYANLMRDKGMVKEAHHHYLTAIRLWPAYASAHNNLGTILQNNTSAEFHYRQAIAIEPKHAGAYFNLANTIHLQGRTREAINHLQTAIQLDPHFPDPYSSLGVIFSEQGRVQEAEELHRKYLLLQPAQPAAYNRMGEFLASQGKTTEALEYYQRAIDLDPKYHISMVNMARIYSERNQTQQARDMYNRALDEQRSTETLYSAGVFFFNAAHTRTAARLFRELIQRKPDHTRAVIHYAQCLTRLNKFNGAEKALLHLLNKDPQNLEGFRELANIYGASKQHQKGIATLEKILALRQNEEVQALTHFQLGNHHKDAGHPETAFKHYKEAVRLQDDIGEAHHNLGVILHLNGSYHAALHHYIRASQLLPDNILVKANLHKLKATMREIEPSSQPQSLHVSVEDTSNMVSGMQGHNTKEDPRKHSISVSETHGEADGYIGIQGGHRVSEEINSLGVDPPGLDSSRFVCDSEICHGDVRR